MVVKQVLDQLKIKYDKIDLGYVVVNDQNVILENTLESALKKSGFEIIKSKEEDISEKIRISIHKLFLEIEIKDLANFNLRKHLESEIQLPYKIASEVFSKQNKNTIEHYFILHRTEKVKAMICDSSYSFTEIAFKLGYNSPSHLSKQFKSVEGITMRNYRRQSNNRRKQIDKI